MMVNRYKARVEQGDAIRAAHLRGGRWVALLLLSLVSATTVAGVTTRVSVDSHGRQSHATTNNYSRSGDIVSVDNGHYVVAFESTASNLVSIDTNAQSDIFVHDSRTGKTQRVSVDSNGVQANGGSYAPRLSANGLYVAFISHASNLVLDDTNNLPDIFVRDLNMKKTYRVSVSSSGEQANDYGYDDNFPSISASGRYVAFESRASNLVPGDTNNSVDVFVRDRDTDKTIRVSVDGYGQQQSGYSYSPRISADGRYVAFMTNATFLDKDSIFIDAGTWISVYDRDTERTTPLRVMTTDGHMLRHYGIAHPVLSANGRYVAFTSFAPNLVHEDKNESADVFIHDRDTGMTERVSVNSAGEEGNHYSGSPSGITADGRYVVFSSYASNFIPGQQSNLPDVLVRDRTTKKTHRVNVSTAGKPAFGDSWASGFSADGRYVVFSSDAANLVPGDTNEAFDVFVHDRRLTQRKGSYGASTRPPLPLVCRGAPATIIGTEGDDYIVGTPGRDVIVGLGGNDVIKGGDGSDIICGDAGNDTLHGEADNDLLSGGAGNDTLHGGKGTDWLFGGTGNDMLLGAPDDGRLDGGEGTDTCNSLSKSIRGSTSTNTANHQNCEK